MDRDGMSVVIFPNSQSAIQTERLFQTEGIESKLIPMPRRVSNECGLALRFPQAESEHARTLLERSGISYQDIREL